jgi:hypothetical protein
VVLTDEDETRTTRRAPGLAGAVGDDPILREWLEGRDAVRQCTPEDACGRVFGALRR